MRPRILSLTLILLGVMTLIVPSAQARIPDGFPRYPSPQITVGPCTLTHFPIGAIANNQVTWYANADVNCTEQMSIIDVGLQLSVTPDGNDPAGNIVWQGLLECSNVSRCPVSGEYVSPGNGPHSQTTWGHARGSDGVRQTERREDDRPLLKHGFLVHQWVRGRNGASAVASSARWRRSLGDRGAVPQAG